MKIYSINALYPRIWASSVESGVMGKLVAFKQKKQAEPALNLSSEFLRVEGIGWVTRLSSNPLIIL